MSGRRTALSIVCILVTAMADGREVAPLAEGWRFHQGEAEGAEAQSFDDSSWSTVRVPHDWSIAGPFDQDNPTGGSGGWLPAGVGWYRLPIDVPQSAEGQRVFVEFDGVMANSDVWVNGQHLGHRPYGYVSFGYEITDHVSPGEQNVIAVRCDNSPQPASRWYTGAGIYRHARLVTTAPVHVDRWGVFVTTPEATDERATVKVATDVVNQGDDTQQVTVESEIVDAAGEAVGKSSSAAQVGAGESQQVATELEVSDPRLWGLDSPHLYQCVTRVQVGGETVDEVTTPFGIRHSEFKPETGYWLNGENLKIKGVCVHHDVGALGAAAPMRAWERRLERLKQLGVNAIRTAHNPPAPELLDLCDRMGYLVMDEFFDVWTVAKRRYDYHRHFEQWAHTDARDTIRRDRNHPSVILYSVGNEIRDTPREEMAKQILRGLVNVCHEADPTRPVTQGLFRPNVSNDYDNGLADMLDVIGTNYRDQELLAAWRDDPTRKIIGTEQSHDRRTWLACRDNPQHSGQFLWCGVDYLGESRRWPVTTFNAGLLDRTGEPRPRAYERQSWWSAEPMVRAFRRIAPNDEIPVDPGYETVEWERRQVLFDDWTPHDSGPHSENVEVYSNCDEVELLLNGESLGAKPLPPGARPRNWDAPYEPGTLVAVGRNDGEEVARHELRTAGAPERVQLLSSRSNLAHYWEDVGYVKAQLVDANGVRVPRADNLVTFSVDGPGEVVAVDSRSIVSLEPFQADERRAYQGRCIAIVRATAPSGTIAVEASAEGLEPGRLELQVTQRP